MRLLNTRFYVSKDLTRDVFFGLIRRWLSESQYIDVTLDDFHMDTPDYSSETDNAKFMISNYEDCFIFQNIVTTEDSVYDTIYVLRDRDEKPSIYVQQNHSYLSYGSGFQRDPDLKLPNLLKFIFWDEYGEDDNGLLTDMKPQMLRKNDVDLAKSIICHEKEFLNPVVYISPTSNGIYETSYARLAEELAGQAHVVVEGSPRVSELIRTATDGQNPFNGAVTVVFPGGCDTRLLPKEKYFHFDIMKTVRKMLNRLSPEPQFDPIRLRQSHIMERLKNGADEEMVAICEELIADKDSEISSLQRELEQMRQQLSATKHKANALQNSFDQAEEENTESGVYLAMNENDLYPDERKDVILKVLRKEMSSMENDANLNTCRKFHVIKDVLEHNFPSGTDVEIGESVRTIFKEPELSKSDIGSLEGLGFRVTKTNGNHYQFVFGDDPRYTSIYSSTPSDFRSGKNFATEYLNHLFGY